VAADAGPCPLSFTCPTCHAKPGEWCKRPSEHRATELHADRLELEFEDVEHVGRTQAAPLAQLPLELLYEPSQLQLGDIDDANAFSLARPPKGEE
jgi:hypothetical protein